MPPAIYESCGCCTFFFIFIFLIFGIFLIVTILADVLWYHYDFNVYFPDVPLVRSFIPFWPFINLPFEVPVKVFRLFFIGLIIFLLLTCRSSLYISYLDVSSVSDMFREYFFPRLWLTYAFSALLIYSIS